MKVYNYINTPIVGSGYRGFTNAPPRLVSIIREYIVGKIEAKLKLQYTILQEGQLPSDILEKYCFVVMTKYSTQRDGKGRPGLKYYHILAVEDPTPDIRQSLVSDPARIFIERYGQEPENNIEQILQYAHTEPNTNINIFFKGLFISRDQFPPLLESMKFSPPSNPSEQETETQALVTIDDAVEQTQGEAPTREKQQEALNSSYKDLSLKLGGQKRIGFIPILIILLLVVSNGICLYYLFRMHETIRAIQNDGASQRRQHLDSARNILVSVDRRFESIDSRLKNIEQTMDTASIRRSLASAITSIEEIKDSVNTSKASIKELEKASRENYHDTQTNRPLKSQPSGTTSTTSTVSQFPRQPPLIPPGASSGSSSGNK